MVNESSNDDVAKVDGESAESARARRTRPYPVSSFEDALSLGEAIMQYAAGEKVCHLTLMQHMNKLPGSGATKMIITNSSKYGITSGGYSAEHLERG